MSERRDPSMYYFSTYHLARDLIGTAVPFTVFLALAVLLFTSVSDALEGFVSIAGKLRVADSWVIGLFFVGIYAGLASMAGTITEEIALIVTSGSIRGRAKRGYETLYAKNKEDIDHLYMQYINFPERFAVDSALAYKVERLCAYFRLHNLQDYSHLYRMYTIASMYRQATVYSLAFALTSFYVASLDLWFGVSGGARFVLAGLLFALAGAVMGYAIRAADQNVVRSEYEFCLATASWLAYREKEQARAKPGGP